MVVLHLMEVVLFLEKIQLRLTDLQHMQLDISQKMLLLLQRFFFTLYVGFVFKTGLNRLIAPMMRYIRSKRSHSDYRKFDDALRMTIDCTPAQLESVKELCVRQKAEGQIYYGIHVSESALMTCFLQKIEDGKHIHFIDGGDGGYAIAAKQLKAQIKRVSQPAA